MLFQPINQDSSQSCFPYNCSPLYLPIISGLIALCDEQTDIWSCYVFQRSSHLCVENKLALKSVLMNLLIIKRGTQSKGVAFYHFYHESVTSDLTGPMTQKIQLGLILFHVTIFYFGLCIHELISNFEVNNHLILLCS